MNLFLKLNAFISDQKRDHNPLWLNPGEQKSLIPLNAPSGLSLSCSLEWYPKKERKLSLWNTTYAREMLVEEWKSHIGTQIRVCFAFEWMGEQQRCKKRQTGMTFWTLIKMNRNKTFCSTFFLPFNNKLEHRRRAGEKEKKKIDSSQIIYFMVTVILFSKWCL